MPLALRLDPTIPMRTPRGDGRAMVVLDPGEDNHLMWVVALDGSGQIWTYQNPDVRVLGNRTLGTHCDMPPASTTGAATEESIPLRVLSTIGPWLFGGLLLALIVGLALVAIAGRVS
jgi:hypothetical protein